MLPNFLVVGAAKSGTTSLYHYLKQHPEIYMSPMKEPQFFCFFNNKPQFQGPSSLGYNRGYISDLTTYEDLFNKVTCERAIGECSTFYLYYPNTAKTIKHYLPDVKIIIILRNPVERAYSFYLFAIMKGIETLSFEEGLSSEKDRLINNWVPIHYYKSFGLYYQQVKKYIDTFGRDKVKIYLFEDLSNEPIDMLRDIWDFLDVDNKSIPDLSIQNRTGLPKIKIVDYITHKPFAFKSLVKPYIPQVVLKRIRKLIIKSNYAYDNKPKMSEKTREFLKGIFRDDILKLQSLIQMDLSGWL